MPPDLSRVDLVAMLQREYQLARSQRRAPAVPTVYTSPNLKLRKAPTYMTSTPERFADSVLSSYDNQKPEVITVTKTAASYDLVAADLTAFLTGREWTSDVFFISVEFLAAQGVSLPYMTFTVTAKSAFGDAISQQVALGALPADAMTRQKSSVVVFPTVTYNGAQLYIPFAFRPAFGAGPLPLLANITVAFSAAPPTGSTVIYNLGTRGTPEVDAVARWALNRRARALTLATMAAANQKLVTAG